MRLAENGSIAWSPASVLRGVLWLLGCAWLQATAQVSLLDPATEEAQAYQQAQQALSAQDWVRAELLLERVLMFNADHAEARVQLASVLAQRGQVDAASALLESLLEDERTPPAYRARLNDMLVQLAVRSADGNVGTKASKQPAQPTVPAGQYSVAVGYTSNPFARADLSTLTFTLADTELTLPVEQTIQPAPFVHNVLAVQLTPACTVEAADQRWQGQELAYANRLVLACKNSFAKGVSASELLLGYRRGQDAVERSYAGAAFQWGAVQVTAHVFDEPATTRQGFFARVRGLYAQEQGTTVVHAEMELGGTSAKSFAGLGIRHEWAVVPSVVAGGALSLQGDLGGYSPLLAANAQRNMALGELYVRKHTLLVGNWHMVSEGAYTRRWSNLPLFAYEDATVQVRLMRPL